MPTSLTVDLTFQALSNSGDFTTLAMVTTSGISEIPTAMIEVMGKDKSLALEEVLGTQIKVVSTGEDGRTQRFAGYCISAEARGNVNGRGRYLLEVRPWLWLLTRARNNRIFQSMTTGQIVAKVAGDHGFGSLLQDKLSSSRTREYCTQYRETDYDFIRRILAEDGAYFYFADQGGDFKMMLTDSPATHPDIDEVPFRDRDGTGRLARVQRWTAVEKVVSGKVTLRDYNFTTPTADLTALSTIKSGKVAFSAHEIYDYPGGYDKADAGGDRAKAIMEAEAAGHQTWRGTGNVIDLVPGVLFDLKDHPDHATDATFMVTRMTQAILPSLDLSVPEGSALQREMGVDVLPGEQVSTRFEAVSKTRPYRAPPPPPRPPVAGVQTAVVTASAGEELTVDKYGRVHVRFHWDRVGKTDDTSSCWVRTMMPWSGKNWGMVALPRAGQEVVIQFEEGDPDRPLCVGMLYNTDTMPPYPLPEQATRTGLKTNSSKGGGGYNELMFEDKKGSELVRLVAEKDFVQTVQNAAHVRIGYVPPADAKAAEAQDKASLKLEVHKHLDEIVETGNHSFTVSGGNQVLKVKKDKTETIEGKSALTVTQDVTATIKTGNLSETLNAGNVTRTLKKGNETHDLSLGNYKLTATAGNVEISAGQSITLKVGANSIKVDMTGVTISGTMVKIDAKAMFEAKAPATQVKGTAALILKGGVTMIN